MSETNKPDDSNDNLTDNTEQSIQDEVIQSGPDAQIQAHRAQHQNQLKKLFGIGGALILIALVVFVLMNMNTSAPAHSDENKQIVEPEYSQAQMDEYREQFKQALTQYEINVQPQIDKILLSDFEVSDVNQLGFQKEQMLGSFAQGLFLQAKSQFETLNKDANQLIDKWQQETQVHIENARQLFEDDQIPLAQLNLNKALALMPTNTDAIKLQARIDAHAEVALLLSNLQVAKVENNLAKQIDLLDDIIQLDPARNELNDDLSEAKSAYDKQQLAQALASAEQALNDNNLSDAQGFVNKAKAVKSNSEGAASLQSRINKAKSNQSLASAKASLNTLSSQDKWDQVASLSARMLQKHPNDKDLFDKQQLAQQVLRAKKSLSLFVTKPERLADQNIREAASQAIQKAFGPSLQSPSLQAQIQSVAQNIDAYSEAVEVTVNSDGDTYIIVVGVGHVGQHVQKTIELTPGEYVLQGRREGYKNKRLNFTVDANTPLSLTLVCDQKI